MLQKYLNTQSTATEEKQIIPVADIDAIATNKNAIKQQDLVNTKKMLLVNFDVDPIKNVYLSNQSGAKSIKVREDVVKDLTAIKTELNGYGIPLSCESHDVSLNNNYISDLARVGLEINLNPYAGMTETKNPEYSDYYIGPDPIQKNKLKIYASAYRDFSFSNSKYRVEKKVFDAYDIRETYGKYPPKTIKVFKNVFDLSKIFEDYGFIQKRPDDQFFKNSDNTKSNWFVFYKPLKINVGYTYKELLLTVYGNNGEPIWYSADRAWDGKKFNDNP